MDTMDFREFFKESKPTKTVDTIEKKTKRVQERFIPQDFLRKEGFKIKLEEPTKEGFRLEFYNANDAREALESLENKRLRIEFTLNGNSIEF